MIAADRLRALVLVFALTSVLASCGGSAPSQSAPSENDSDITGQPLTPAPEQAGGAVPSPEPTVSESSETAYDMPYQDERYDEGTDPDLDDDTDMYVLVHSSQEGTPFTIEVDGFETLLFNARTPYYVDLDDIAVNEYGHVGSGSIAVLNGNTDDAPIYVEFHSFIGTIESDSCYGYDCQVVLSWDGPD